MVSTLPPETPETARGPETVRPPRPRRRRRGRPREPQQAGPRLTEALDRARRLVERHVASGATESEREAARLLFERIEALTRLETETDQLRQELRSEQAELRSALASARRTISIQEQAVARLERSVAFQEAHTSGRDAQLARLRASLAERERELGAARRGAEASARELDEARRAVAEQAEELRQRDEELLAVRAELSQRAGDGAQEPGALERLRAELLDREAQLRWLREELAAERDAHDAARRAQGAEQEQARRYRDGLGAAEQALAERARECSELRAELAERRRAASPGPVRTPDPRGVAPGALAAPGAVEGDGGMLEVLEDLEVLEEPDEFGDLAQLEEFEDLSELEAPALELVEVVLASGAEREPDPEASRLLSAAALGPAAEPAAPARSGARRGGWRLLPWIGARSQTSDAAGAEFPDRRRRARLEAAAAQASPRGGEPDADPSPGAESSPLAEAAADLPAIHHYWRRRQIESKLAMPGIASTDDFFLQYLLDACRGDPERTHRIVSLGTGSRDLEVVLAQRAVRAGVRNFNLQCLSPAPSHLSRPEAIRAEPSVLEHLTLVQCQAGDWPREGGYSLCLVNQSLLHLPAPELWLEKIRAAIEPHGSLVVSAPLARLDRGESPVAREIASQVWQLLPERYRSLDGRRLPGPQYASERRSGSPDASGRGSALLPQLMRLFHFEVFVAFGNVINAFVDRAVGPNFDPAQERDRRFIDQVAALDDAKIDAGLYPPTHLLAALRTQPVENPIHFRHWTPEFCLGRAPAKAAPGQARPGERDRRGAGAPAVAPAAE